MKNKSAIPSSMHACMCGCVCTCTCVNNYKILKRWEQGKNTSV